MVVPYNNTLEETIGRLANMPTILSVAIFH